MAIISDGALCLYHVLTLVLSHDSVRADRMSAKWFMQGQSHNMMMIGLGSLTYLR
jgi:hypothetical protein